MPDCASASSVDVGTGEVGAGAGIDRHGGGRPPGVKRAYALQEGFGMPFFL